MIFELMVFKLVLQLLDTAQAKADAINAISDQTGVTASASTIVDLALDFNIAATDTSFLINGLL